jgi:DNA invertase Pin-like site-specific DNA recombinase
MVKAAVYARISSDDGTALGVTRQVEDCHRLADSLGWDVAEDYIDNDVSAYSAKQRPAYQRMLADLADGYRDAVIVYHADRLTRRPIELEQFLETVTAAGVKHVKFVSGGDLDVGNGDGLMVLRMLSAVAANESDAKSRRVRRKMEEVALSGRPHGGTRPFGFEADKATLRPDETAVIRRIVARFIAGESYRSLAAWLDDEGIKTVAGGPWTTTTLRSLLRSGRIAGLREHRGQVVAKASWDPIISEADRDKVLARMEAAKANPARRTPRRYLLSGLLRCGKCGTRLYSAARQDRRRYVCMSGPDHGGCGKLTVVAPPVEELIAAAVLYRLDTPELAASLTGQAAADAEAAALSDALAADRAQLDELAQLYAAKAIGAREWMAARNPIEARIADTERRLGRMTRTDALTGWIGNSGELRSRWSELNLTRQAAIVAAIVDHAVIGPGTPGARELDPSRVELIWKL